MILSNQIKCNKCGDTPWSQHRWDFKPCKCEAVYVDGGMSYRRRLGEPKDWTDMSIVIDDKHAEGLKQAIEDPSKNALGKLCNVARYLRDEMGINIGDSSDEEG